jgi:hypothetical protein
MGLSVYDTSPGDEAVRNGTNPRTGNSFQITYHIKYVPSLSSLL